MGHFGLGRLVISANFQSDSFWPLVLLKSESDNVCIIICVWIDRCAGVKFCEKQAKMKKGPFRTRAGTTHVKMP